MGIKFVINIIVFVLAVISSVIDIRKKEIPAVLLVLCSLSAAASLAADFSSDEFFILDLGMAFLPGLFLLALAFLSRQSIGYGDGLFMLGIAPACGFYGMCKCMLVALFTSSLVAIVILALRKGTRKTKMPFVPFATLGLGVSLFATAF